jgi:CheY-like chemotaxis protein
VIAVTASALGDVRQTVHDAGCVDYLSKPVRAELLFALLERHLGVRFVSETEPAPGDDASVIDLARRGDIAARLRHAVDLGDVGEIRRLARDLMAGDPGEAAVGERIDGLAINFDFGGLNELADSLATST